MKPSLFFQNLYWSKVVRCWHSCQVLQQFSFSIPILIIHQHVKYCLLNFLSCHMSYFLLWYYYDYDHFHFGFFSVQNSRFNDHLNYNQSLSDHSSLLCSHFLNDQLLTFIVLLIYVFSFHLYFNWNLRCHWFFSYLVQSVVRFI